VKEGDTKMARDKSHIYKYMNIYTYIYIYIYSVREGCIYICMYVIYIYRERDRGGHQKGKGQ
jgi:hypothetical protein